MKNGNSVFDRLTYKRKGVVFLIPCIDVVCYWAGSAFDRINGIVDFYEQSLAVIGKAIRFYQTETMAQAAPLKKDSLGLIPFWFRKTKSRRDVYILLLESGESANDVSDSAFAFQAIEAGDESTGYIRLILPVSFIDKDADKLLEFAERLIQRLDFGFGQAGYSLNWNEIGQSAELATATMTTLAKRYPGLDLSDPGSTQYTAADGIKCVNWLTIINESSCEHLGGIKKLEKELGEDIHIHRLPRGVMIQAGPRPEIGDVNRRQTLPLYHQVGRVLAPIRSSEHPAFLTVNGVEDDDATNEWLSRFDT